LELKFTSKTEETAKTTKPASEPKKRNRHRINEFTETSEVCFSLHRLQSSRLLHSHSPLSQVRLAPLDAGHKLRPQFSTVFEIVSQPILQLQSLITRERADFPLDFGFTHAGIF